MTTPMEKLEEQVAFVAEIDKLKHVYRQTFLMDGSRNENDAEHSWHLATMAILLSEHAADPEVDLLRTVKMILVHDLVEIDAGDTFAYDEEGAQDKADREQKAAERIFALLPEDQGREIHELWTEFEGMETPESRFAASLDRFQPLLHNIMTGGGAWKKHGVTSDRVIARNRHIAKGSPRLWEYAERLINEAVERGDLAP